jgi:hypothetical protein
MNEHQTNVIRECNLALAEIGMPRYTEVTMALCRLAQQCELAALVDENNVALLAANALCRRIPQPLGGGAS